LFLKHGGTLAVKGERQHLYDLEQGRLKLLAEYCFLTSDQNLLNKMAAINERKKR